MALPTVTVNNVSNQDTPSPLAESLALLEQRAVAAQQARQRNEAMSRSAQDLAAQQAATYGVVTPQQAVQIAEPNAIQEREAALGDARKSLLEREAALNDPSQIIPLATLESPNGLNRAVGIFSNGILGVAGTVNTMARNALSIPAQTEYEATLAAVPQSVKQAFNSRQEILNQQAKIAEELSFLSDVGNTQETQQRITALQAQAAQLKVPAHIEQLLNQVNPATKRTYMGDIEYAGQKLSEVNAIRLQNEAGEPLPENPSNWMNRGASANLRTRLDSNKEISALDAEAKVLSEQGDKVGSAIAVLKSTARSIGITADAIGNNPSIPVVSAMESLPNFLNPLLGAVTYGAGLNNDLVNKFKQANGGELELTEDNTTRATGLAIASAANFVGAKSVNNAARGIVKPSNLVTGATAVAVNTAKPALYEGGAEGVQVAIEDGLGFGEVPTGKAIGEGATIGAAAGGLMGSPGAFVASVSNELGKASAARAESSGGNTRAAAQAELDAIPTEEISTVGTPNYNPTEAIKRFNNEFTAATTDEEREGVFQRTETIVANTESGLKAQQEELTRIQRAKDPEEFARIQQMIATRREAASANPTDPNNAVMLTRLDEMEKTWNERKATDTTELEAKIKENAALFTKVKEAAKPLMTARQKMKPAMAAPAKDSVEEIVSSYPTSVNALRAVRIAEDMTNNLTEDQRNQLRVFSTAVVAANEGKKVKDTNDFVMQGGVDSANQRFFGLADYMREMADAVKVNDTTSMQVLTDRLDNFSYTQNGKAEVAASAFAEATPEMAQTIFRSGNEWVRGEAIPVTELTRKRAKEIRTNGGLFFRQDAASQKLAETIKSEAIAIDQVGLYFDSMNSVARPAQSTEQLFDAELNGVQATPATAPTQAVPEAAVNTNTTTPPVVAATSATASNTNVQSPVVTAPATSTATQATQNTNNSAAPSTTSNTAAAVTNGFNAISEGMEAAARTEVAKNITEGKTDRLTFRKPDAIAAALANPNYNTVENTDGSVTVIGVKTDESGWVGVKPTPKTNPNPNTDTVSEDISEVIEDEASVDSTDVTAQVTDTIVNDTGEVSTIVEDVAVLITEDDPAAKAKKSKGTLAATRSSKKDRKGRTTKQQQRDLVKESNGAKDGSGYQRANIVTASFTQAKTSILAIIENFAQQLNKSPLAFYESLLGRSVASNERTALALFVNFEKSFSNATKQLWIKKKDPLFNFQDFSQYLAEETVNEDGSKSFNLNDNVHTALAAAAYTWLAENTSKRYNTPQEVAALLGVKNSDGVTGETYKRYSEIGSLRTNAILDLGLKAYNALGLKLDPNENTERKERLINSLGSLAVQAMLTERYLEMGNVANLRFSVDRNIAKDVVDSEGNIVFPPGTSPELLAVLERYKGVTDSAELTTEIKRLYSNNPDEAAKVLRAIRDVIYFVRPIRNTDGTLVQKTESIVKANKGSGSIINKLFGVPTQKIPLSLKPIAKIKQTTIDDTGAEIPSELRKRAEAMQQIPYQINSEMVEMYRKLWEDPTTRDSLYEMLGYTPEMVLETLHSTHADAKRSVNEAIVRGLTDMFDSVDSIAVEGEQLPNVYLPVSIWSVNRIGVTSNGLNEQGSKIHRSVIAPASHRVEVDLSTAYMDESGITAHGYYLLALGQHIEDASGMNGLVPDKTNAATYLPQMVKFLGSDQVAEAVAAMREIRAAKATPENMTVVRNAVADFGLESMSFLGLNSLVDYFDAKENGTPFTSTLSFGSDGVNNGVILSEVVYGSASNQLLNQGGLYLTTSPVTDRAGNEITNVPNYKAQKFKDYYEALAGVITEKMRGLEPKFNRTVGLLAFFDSEFNNRKGAKVIAVPFNYGAGIGSINKRLTEKVIDNAYAMAAKAANDQAQLNVIAANLNALIDDKYTVIELTPENAKTFTLSSRAVKRINLQVTLTRGKAVKAALNQQAEQLIKARTDLLNASEFGFNVFNILYQAALAKANETAMANGEVFFRRNKDNNEYLLESMSQVQREKALAEIAEYDSRIVSANGIGSDNAWESAHRTYGVDMEFNENNALRTEVAYNLPKQGIQYAADQSQLVRQNSTNKMYPRTPVFVSRGAGMSAAIIQAMDAYITSVSASNPELATTNHHDENSGAVTQVVAMAQAQNKAFLDIMLKYHVGLESLTAFMQPLKGLVALNDKLGLQESVGQIKELLTDIRGEKNSLGFLEDLYDMVESGVARDLTKLNTLSSVKAVNQYGTEGGEYFLTDADYAAIETARNEVMKRREVAINALGKLLNEIDAIESGKAVATTVPVPSPHVAPIPVLEETVAPAVAEKVQTEVQKVNEYITKVVTQQNGKATVKDVLDFVQSLNMQFAPKGLTDLLGKVIDGNTEINFITHDNKNKLGVRVGRGNSLTKFMASQRAWVHTNTNGESQVNFNTTHIEAVNAEVLLHELVHVVADVAITSKDPKYAEAKEQLQMVMDAAKKHGAVLRQNMSPQMAAIFDEATSSMREFVAITFTNPEFQQILKSIIVPSSNAKKFQSRTLFKEFVQWLSNTVENIFGVKVTAEINTGLGLAVAASVSLFQDRAAPQQETLSFYPVDQAYNEVRDYTATEVFNGLDGDLTNEFGQKLKLLMSTVVSNSYDVLEQFGLLGGKTYSPQRLWEKAANEGKTPFVSKLVQYGFTMTGKEKFAVESLETVVKAALENGFSSVAYTEMIKAYEAAKSKLTARDFYKGDWSIATQDEKDIAAAKHEVLFGITSTTDGKSDYLARFIALGLANEEVSNLLAFKADRVKGKQNTLFEKAIEVVNSVMNWSNGYITKTLLVQKVSDKLPLLVTQLVDIDNKARDNVMGSVEQRFERLNNSANELGKEFSEKAANAIDFIAQSNNKAIAGVGKTAQDLLRGNIERTFDTIREWRNFENPNTVLGWGAELMNELAAPNGTQKAVNRLISRYSMIQEMRQRIIEQMRSNTLAIFKDKPNLKTRNAVTNVLLRSGMYHLLPSYGITGIKTFLVNTQRRNVEIAKLEKQLNALPNGDVMRVRAKDLALYVIKGEGRTGLVKNTEGIAKQLGTSQYTEVAPTQAVELLNKLVPLYTIQYQKNKADVMAVVELIENDTQAVTDLMRYQQRLDAEAKPLFADNGNSRVFGYMPEIVNGHREIRVASSLEEAKALKDMGFKESHRLKVDTRDTGGSINGERILFFSEESSQQRYVSGAMSISDTASKGTSIYANKSGLMPKDAYIALKQAEKQTEQELLAKAKNPNYDPAKAKSSIVPHYSNDGRVIDFSYEMSSEIRDGLLERKNDFSELFGAYAGNTFDKVNAPEHNKVVMDSLYKDYLANATKKPNEYVSISSTSADPRLREIYATIPYETLKYAQDLWGTDEIIVSNSVILATFGYAKYSIGDMFDKDPEMRSAVESLVVQTAGLLLGDTAKVKLMKADRAWVETVAFIKDVIVIRNFTTWFGNQTSNMAILSAMGINPKQLVERSIFALRAGMQYRKDMAMKISLEQRIDANVGNVTELRTQLLRVEDSLNRNPLKDFIAEGMLPTIVEDLDVDSDSYSYKSKLTQKIDEMTSGVPQPIKDSVNWLMVSPSTPLYKFMSNATQFSDFTAKFVLYDHMTNRKNKPMSKEDALDLADTMFINYGVPTSKFMQGLNDRGIIMFSKYNIRIQRAMLYLLKEYPASTIAQALIASGFGTPSPLAPVVGIGNPFSAGAFNLPSAMTEPVPIKLILGM